MRGDYAHPSDTSVTNGHDSASPELGDRLLVEQPHRSSHRERRSIAAQLREVAVQFRSQLRSGCVGQREVHILAKRGHHLSLGGREHWLGMAKTGGNGDRVYAHHSHGWGTEHLGPFRRRPKRPRCASDDEGNNSNKNDSTHTHDGIDATPLRIYLRPKSHLHNLHTIT